MSDDLRQLIEEATRLELNMAEVYLGFHHLFPDDARFWWKLGIEEKNHAALLLSGKQYFLEAGMFPAELVGTSLATLKSLNGELEGIVGRGGGPRLSRAAAFDLAIRLEDSAGEIHFQHAMQDAVPSSKAISLFQSLNEADLDHADRIRNYMRQASI